MIPLSLQRRLTATAALTLAVTLAATPVARPVAAQVTRVRDLAFGTIVTGTTTSIDVTGSGAAMWRIHVTLVSLLGSFSLTLPTTLARSGGGGTMPISFCGTCGRYRVNSSSVSGATAFNPSTTVTFPSLALSSDVYIWLGGAVSPPANQPPGSYSGTIVITTSGLII